MINLRSTLRRDLATLSSKPVLLTRRNQLDSVDLLKRSKSQEVQHGGSSSPKEEWFAEGLHHVELLKEPARLLTAITLKLSA